MSQSTLHFRLFVRKIQQTVTDIQNSKTKLKHLYITFVVCVTFYFGGNADLHTALRTDKWTANEANVNGHDNTD